MTDIEEGEEANPQMSLQTRLIKEEKYISKQTLLKNSYTAVGGNGYLEIEPAILRFAGFQLNKINRKQVCVRNTSVHPKRIHILRPTTPLIKLNYTKKGSVAAGMSQHIYVDFEPSDYKYHYDCVRIHSEGENILIPIHAYPILTNKKPIIPKFIDMGIQCLGTTKTKMFKITSESEVTFEYEINILKDNPEMRIFPLSGEIPGYGKALIQVDYTPSRTSTSTLECEMKTSEFDFSPEFIRISGSGISQNVAEAASKAPVKGISVSHSRMSATLNKSQSETHKGKTPIEDDLMEGESKIVVKKTKGKTLLQMKPAYQQRSIGASIKLGKLGDGLFGRGIPDTSKPKLAIKQDEAIAEGVHPNILIFEEKFVKKFRETEKLEREKEIKFFQVIGDRAMTEDEGRNIDEDREENESYLKQYEKDEDRDRIRINAKNRGCIKDLEREIFVKPKWDVYKNDQFSLRQRYMDLFLKAANTILTRIRADKRLRLIKQKFEEWGVRGRDDCKRMVAQDWKAAQSQAQGNLTFIDFSFNLEEGNMEVCKLPVEYEGGMALFQEQVEVSPFGEFDDYTTYKTIEKQDYEVHNYQPFPIPSGSNYFPIQETKPLRRGCEYEYAFRQKRGDPDLEEMEEKDKAMEIPKTFNKPLDIPPEKLVMPHPSLRGFAEFKLYSEVDPEFHFYPRERERKPLLDEIYMKNRAPGYKGTLIDMPGYSSMNTLDAIPNKISDYYKQRLDLPKTKEVLGDNFGGIPQLIPKSLDVDKFSESDSDIQNKVDLKVPNLENLMNEFETDDKGIGELRAREKEGKKFSNIRDEKLNKMNRNIGMERMEWASMMPTAMGDLNSYIVHPDNKQYLL